MFDSDFEVASRVLDFTSKIHSGVRKDGVTPEFQHQVEIALYLRTLGPNIPRLGLVISGSLIHDTFEDYHSAGLFTYDSLAEKFGKDVANLAKRLSKLRPPDMKLSNNSYYDNLVSGDDPSAALIKGADRIHNVGSMVGVFTTEKMKAYIEETEKFVLPMLKTCRRTFPKCEPQFENMKFVLNHQLKLIKTIINNYDPKKQNSDI